MAEFFHIKKRVVACICSLLIIALCVFQAYRIERAQLIAGKSFYFLVEKAENTEACAYLSYQKGGAGFVLQEGVVAHSCYTDERDAIMVKERLSTENEIELLVFGGEMIYKKTEDEPFFKGMSTLQSCVQLLNEVANGLTESLTQQKADAVLHDIQTVLRGLKKRIVPVNVRFSSFLEEVEQRVGMARKGVIFAKDLRQIACFTALGIVNLEKEHGA